MARMSARERKLAETLASPVLWGQGYLRNRDGSPRVYWPHQVEDLLCGEKNIIHLDGRDVGKSVCITTDALHFAFTTRGGQGLIAAPHQGHLDTLTLAALAVLLVPASLVSGGRPNEPSCTR